MVAPPKPPVEVAPPAAPPAIPVTPEEMRFVATLGVPPPDVAWRRCYVCGRPFLGPDNDTIDVLVAWLPFPREYWETCPDCALPRWGWGKHKVEIELALEARAVNPLVRPWLQELAEKLPDP